MKSKSPTPRVPRKKKVKTVMTEKGIHNVIEQLTALELVEKLVELAKIGDIKVERNYLTMELGESLVFHARNEKEYKYIPLYVSDGLLPLKKKLPK